MSLEESMKTLAESNNKLAESHNKLAAAMTHYAEVIQEHSRLVAVSGGEEPAKAPAAAASKPTAAKGKGKGKAADPEPKNNDDDGFGDEGGDESEIPDKITADQIKAKLIAVKDAYGDKAPALAIIQKLGYEAIPDVKPADYKKVWIACDKALAEAE